MKRLNIYGAFLALAGPGTKEDIIIQVAKQQNIRFNELPQLQKEVDQALEESQRLGFIDRQGAIYKLSMEVPPSKSHNSTTSKTASTKTNKETNVERNTRQLNGQGDGKRSQSAVSTRSSHKSTNNTLCSTCSGMDPKSCLERRKNSNNLDKIILAKDASVCSICGLESEKPVSPEEQEAVWPNMRTVL
ncbi:uncharacterized protein LOC117785565 [Drosophila innubila]|uniref:uncharacterized protein LOC117785565 n=1 Tax=Drosophila innubila TaxID=198719 RepID=UPI00148E2348|nr:uncharacterized protein LOC117785565 [Drosophila innubila]